MKRKGIEGLIVMGLITLLTSCSSGKDLGTINKAGIYSGDQSNDLIVNIGDVTLKNMTINGDLYIDKNITKGNITLDHVTVLGKTYVNGGEKSITLKDTNLKDTLIVAKEAGKLIIKALKNTTVDKTELRYGATLEDDSDNGFDDVEILCVKSGQSIKLDGDFDEVIDNASNININAINGIINHLIVKKNLAGIKITLDKTSTFDEATLDSATNIAGGGLIRKVNINTLGTVIEKMPSNINILSNLTALIAGKQYPAAAVPPTNNTSTSNTTTVKPVTTVKKTSTTQKVSDVSSNVTNSLVKRNTALTLSTSTTGATIYYTIDGTYPTKNSIKYAIPIVIDKNITIKAIAFKDGYESSNLVTFIYEITKSDECDIVGFDNVAGTINQNNINITVNSDVTKIDLNSILKISNYATMKYYRDADMTKEITSNYQLIAGNNYIFIKVTAENRTTKVYKLIITRQVTLYDMMMMEERYDGMLWAPTGNLAWQYSKEDSDSFEILAQAFGEWIDNNIRTASAAQMTEQYVIMQNAIGILADKVKDPYENDDNILYANALSTDGSSMTHFIAPSGDVDYYKFNAIEGHVYMIKTFDVKPTYLEDYTMDTEMVLYNQDGSIKEQNDDNIIIRSDNEESSDEYSSLITFIAPSTGTNYFLVRHLGIYAGIGEYKISVTDVTSTIPCTHLSDIVISTADDPTTPNINEQVYTLNILSTGERYLYEYNYYHSSINERNPVKVTSTSVGSDNYQLYIVNSNNVLVKIIYFKVTVIPAASPQNIKSVMSAIDGLNLSNFEDNLLPIFNGYPFSSMLEELSNTWLATLENNQQVFVPIKWTSTDYNPYTDGIYTIVGNIELPQGITNTNNIPGPTFQVKVTSVIPEAK